MLQKDGFFRKREDGYGAKSPSYSPASPASPAPAAPAAPEAKSDPAPSKAASAEAPRGDARKEAKLVVGPDIKMKGVEISDCDTLVVEGRMEATLDSRVLEIAQNGVFQGTIAVDQAVIHGRFEGELTVRKHLVIQATGRVSGKIRTARIKVEEGAELAGEIGMLDQAAQEGRVRRAA